MLPSQKGFTQPLHARAGFTLWFTGLPCSGKTTLSTAVEKKLRRQKIKVEHLDGDAVRKKFGGDLGYSKKDRELNVKRVAMAASLLTQNGVATLVSLISPYESMRQNARSLIHPFIEIYLRCPLRVCEKRDRKNMYRLAREGKIENFTGVSDPYEEPSNPELVLDTDVTGVENCVEKILKCLQRKKFILRRKLG